MSDIRKMCICGKNRGNSHITNWKKHLDYYKAKKTVMTSQSITSFFSVPKKAQLEVETFNPSCSNVKY
jgi:hypothetical protein